MKIARISLLFENPLVPEISAEVTDAGLFINTINYFLCQGHLLD